MEWRSIVLLGLSSAAMVACGGQSEHSGAPTVGSGGSGASSAGWSAAAGTSASGSGSGSGGRGDGGTFGAGAGRGSGGRAVGAAGDPGNAPAECLEGDLRRPEGSVWDVDCNTCHCIGGEVLCSVRDCVEPSGGSPARAGASATGGMGAGGNETGGNETGGNETGGQNGAAAGMGGKPGQPPSCSYADIGSLCVLGTPSNDGTVTLSAGMPLTVSLQPVGCYSSSCTQLVSSSCNTIGSGFFYQVSGFICLATEGEVCTDDCGGAHAVACEAGVTLEEGVYTVGIGGSPVSVKFTVPSSVTPGELCAP